VAVAAGGGVLLAAVSLVAGAVGMGWQAASPRLNRHKTTKALLVHVLVFIGNLL
jgi:hypothetical protein